MPFTYKKQFEKIKKHLKIEKILSIRFSDTKTKNFKRYNDTACTALARSFEKNKSMYIDRKLGQLCAGGNFFLNITNPSKKEICDVYVKDEKIFQNNAVCNNFLKNLPKYPTSAKKRYILFTPLKKEKNKPDMIMLLVNPAQAGRILGLAAYRKIVNTLVMPAIPTCASIYAPLNSNKIHLNFIDYFDRYYQGKQNKRLLWKDSHLIISMSFNTFKEIVGNIQLSAHGSCIPKVKKHLVDCI